MSKKKQTQTLKNESLTKESLTKESLTKESLAKESLTKESLAKESLTKESMVPVLIACFGLAIICLIAYFPGLSNALVDWDDLQYVYEVSLINDLSFGGIRHIFSRYLMGNYHPFTVLSLIFNYNLSGVEPFSYHLTNLVIHIFNSILVLLVILRMNKGMLAAGITAALFAVHPMHVESVVWAAERKDVLYTFFFLCSFLSYLKYIHTGHFRLMALALVLFIFSCFSKGMAVTLPLIMFAADYAMGRKNVKNLFVEKIPFLLVSMVFGIVAVDAQQKWGAIADFPEYGFIDRIFLAIYSFVFYLNKMIVPTGLSAFYPYPVKTGNWFPPLIYFSLMVLFIYKALAFYTIKREKFVFFGILFYGISILPMVQLLPVGDMIAADRYFYVSSIGLFFIAGVVAEKLVNWYGLKFVYLNTSIIMFFAAIIGILTYLSNQQSRVWKNDFTLLTHALKAQPLSHVANTKMGINHQLAGRTDQAIEYYEKALSLRRNSTAANNLGQCYVDKKQYALSLPYFQLSIALKPNDSQTWFNMGNAYDSLGNYNEAVRDYTIALEHDKNLFKAYNNRACAFFALGKWEEGNEDMRIAARGGHATAIQYLKGLERERSQKAEVKH
jgi:tetratricopeptide (TPR) repeat protein